jgi:hypothetical protein
MSSWLEDRARTLADAAGGRQGEEHQTDAIGEGLAAVAYALLEVAAAIREHSERRRRTMGRPGRGGGPVPVARGIPGSPGPQRAGPAPRVRRGTGMAVRAPRPTPG